MAETKKATTGKKASTVKKKVTKKTSRRSNTKASPPEVEEPAATGIEQGQENTEQGRSPLNENVMESKPQLIPVQQLNGSKILSLFALLFSVVALVAGGYAWYVTVLDSKLVSSQQQNRLQLIDQKVTDFEQLQSDYTEQIFQIRTRMSQVDNDINDVNEQVSRIQETLESRSLEVSQQLKASQNLLTRQSEDFKRDFDILSASILKLRSELGRSLDNWTLEEVEQLLSIANQHILFSDEIDLAAKALELADARLEKLADPTLSSLRKQLADDIVALQSIEQQDMVGVLNDLSMLSKRVYTLPLAGDMTDALIPKNGEADSDDYNTGATDDDSATGTFDQMVKPVSNAVSRFFEQLGDLIQIEKDGVSLKPIVSDHQRQLTYERTRLYLEAAQIAYVRKDAALYANRMTGVGQWVEEKFDINADATVEWLQQLEALESSSMTFPNMDISGSLKAMQAVMESRQ